MGLNVDNMRLWVAALRSGEFEQGNTVLTQVRPDGSMKHCCLGVACRVAMAHGVDLRVSAGDEDDASSLVYGEERRVGTLPLEVLSWLGIPECDLGTVVPGDPVLLPHDDDVELYPHRASVWNDAFNKSFLQIADMIEKTYGLKE